LGSGKPGGVGPPQEVPKSLKPCSNVVYGDSYRTVLRRVTEVWDEETKIWDEESRGVTFYELYSKERVLSSKNGLKMVLDTLTNCGYLACREGRARTNSPLGRKEYYPTPLGVLMDLVLSLLDLLKKSSPNLVPGDITSPLHVHKLPYRELRDLIKGPLYDTVPIAYMATVLLYPKPQLPPYITRGRDALYYVVGLLLTEILLIETRREAVSSSEGYRDPTLWSSLMKEVERGICEALGLVLVAKSFRKNLDLRKEHLLDTLSTKLPRYAEEEVVSEALDRLESSFRSIIKFIEVHRKTKSTSQATSPMS